MHRRTRVRPAFRINSRCLVSDPVNGRQVFHLQCGHGSGGINITVSISPIVENIQIGGNRLLHVFVC